MLRADKRRDNFKIIEGKYTHLIEINSIGVILKLLALVFL